MSLYNYCKIVASIWPTISKETILAKILHQIDIFRLRLNNMYDDVNKRYVESIQKMDSSKTIMLDIKWPEIKIRSDHDFNVKKWDILNIKYTEWFEDEEKTIFIDYKDVSDIPEWTLFKILWDGLQIQVLKNKDGEAQWKVLWDGTISATKEIFFENYVPKIYFLSKKDQKDILWSVNNWIRVISPANVRMPDDLKTLRTFLDENWGKGCKIVAKIHTIEAIENINEILDNSDGIMIDTNLGDVLPKDQIEWTKNDIIRLANEKWKPVIFITRIYDPVIKSQTSEETINEIKKHLQMWIDAISIPEETSAVEYAMESIGDLYKVIVDHQESVDLKFDFKDLKGTKKNEITDYIIYNAYKISKEFDIKVIICPTETGYTPARLAALKPTIPIICFTKNNDTYRFLNLLRGVKGYKIATWFTYDNIKRIWKEIIRFMNKWDMSLDVKVLMVHSTISETLPNMINWIEIYRFKDL